MDENSSVLYIAHFGTRGMKWGIRKYQNRDGSLTPAGRARYGKGQSTPRSRFSQKSSITKTSVAKSENTPRPAKKKMSEMSDEELRNEINRLSLEKQYKQLVSEINPSNEHKARQMISEMAATSVKNIGTQTMTYAMGAAVNKVCRGVFKIDHDIVNPKKGQSDKK